MIVEKPSLAIESPKPMVVVDFPSPAFVGVIAVTKMILPLGLSLYRLIASKLTFAL